MKWAGLGAALEAVVVPVSVAAAAVPAWSVTTLTPWPGEVPPAAAVADAQPRSGSPKLEPWEGDEEDEAREAVQAEEPEPEKVAGVVEVEVEAEGRVMEESAVEKVAAEREETGGNAMGRQSEGQDAAEGERVEADRCTVSKQSEEEDAASATPEPPRGAVEQEAVKVEKEGRHTMRKHAEESPAAAAPDDLPMQGVNDAARAPASAPAPAPASALTAKQKRAKAADAKWEAAYAALTATARPAATPAAAAAAAPPSAATAAAAEVTEVIHAAERSLAVAERHLLQHQRKPPTPERVRQSYLDKLISTATTATAATDVASDGAGEGDGDGDGDGDGEGKEEGEGDGGMYVWTGDGALGGMGVAWGGSGRSWGDSPPKAIVEGAGGGGGGAFGLARWAINSLQMLDSTTATEWKPAVDNLVAESTRAMEEEWHAQFPPDDIYAEVRQRTFTPTSSLVHPCLTRRHRAWCHRLKLQSDEALSNFASNVNLRRYAWEFNTKNYPSELRADELGLGRALADPVG
jgi:hypothetical protein